MEPDNVPIIVQRNNANPEEFKSKNTKMKTKHTL